MSELLAELDELIQQKREALRQEAARAYREQGNLRAAAKVMGMSAENLRHWLHEAGVNTQRKRAYKKREVKG
jgi:hypothetical protein